MGKACDDDCCPSALKAKQSSVLKAVLLINAVMFIFEATAGVLSNSVSLLADSLDMLADAVVYGFSLYVITRGGRWISLSALLKGVIMAVFGVFVLGEAIYRALYPAPLFAPAIGVVGTIALIANCVCLWLLWRHRTDDINMHSVWLCSRNDIIANVSVIIAAVAVMATGSNWPDVMVGLSIAALFLRSAGSVLYRATAELKS